jgi:hypothetical protein
MSLKNRVDRLEDQDGMCPHCGEPKPITIIEVIMPLGQDDMRFATPEERRIITEIGAKLHARRAAERGDPECSWNPPPT